MQQDCVFCDIANGKTSTELEYEDNNIVAFSDMNPQAPIHILIVTKEHIPSIAEITASQQWLVGELVNVAQKLAAKEGISEKGYRLVINCRSEGGQVVPHLHMHLLGGRKLSDRHG